MTGRRHLALGAVLVLVALGGCLAGGDIADETLDAEAEYAWDADADVHVRVEVGQYYAVYDLDGETTFELTRSTIYQDRAIDIEAVRFRYPNGTELTGSELAVSQSRSTTTVEVPDGNGTLAFAGPAGSKTVTVPGLVAGSYEVALPADHRVGDFILSNVRPSHSASERVGDRQVLTWEENDDDLSIRFYLSRDVYLFWGTIIGLTLIGAGGVAYYRRQIERLARQRRRLAEDIGRDR